MHRPPQWRPSRRQPPHERVSFVTLSGPQASRDGIAHFFESGQRRRLRWGRVEKAPLMPRSSAASTGYIAAIDEKAWAGPRRSARVQVPTREPALPTGDSSRAEYAGARSSHPLERGCDRSPVAPPGTGCVRANGPSEELDDGSSCVYQCYRSGSILITEYVRQNLWGASPSNVYEHIGPSATGRVTFRRSCRSRLKEPPIRAIRWRTKII